MVAKCRRTCSRTCDIHKQHGSEYPLWLVRMASSLQKLFDLIKNRILITKKSHMVLARKLNQLCAGDTLSHVACMLHVDHTLCGTVQNEPWARGSRARYGARRSRAPFSSRPLLRRDL